MVSIWLDIITGGGHRGIHAYHGIRGYAQTTRSRRGKAFHSGLKLMMMVGVRSGQELMTGWRSQSALDLGRRHGVFIQDRTEIGFLPAAFLQIDTLLRSKA